jgi:hypothetical protein
MNYSRKYAHQNAQVKVAADGCRNIPEAIAIKLIHNLFENIGVDRLRASRQFQFVQFNEVDELCDLDLCEAIHVGLSHLNDHPVDAHAQARLIERIEAQMGTLSQPFAYRVGRSYSKRWPKAVAH